MSDYREEILTRLFARAGDVMSSVLDDTVPPLFPTRDYIMGCRDTGPKAKRKRPYKGSKAAKRASRRRT